MGYHRIIGAQAAQRAFPRSLSSCAHTPTGTRTHACHCEHWDHSRRACPERVEGGRSRPNPEGRTHVARLLRTSARNGAMIVTAVFWHALVRKNVKSGRLLLPGSLGVAGADFSVFNS